MAKHPMTNRVRFPTLDGQAGVSGRTSSLRPPASSLAGFTMIEMLVVIMIIGTLAAMLLPAVQSARKNAKVGAAKGEIRSLEIAMTAYYSDWSEYPPDRTDSDPTNQREPVTRNLDAAQCLVYCLGTKFRMPIGNGPGFTRNGGPYFDFPADRFVGAGVPRFQDLLGAMRGPSNAVTFYRFDNNDADDGTDPWRPPTANWQNLQISATDWNVTNVHEQSVDIWCSGWDGIDCISGRDSAGNLVVTWPVNPRKSDPRTFTWPYNNDGDYYPDAPTVERIDEDAVDGLDNDTRLDRTPAPDGKIDEDPKEDDFGNW